MTFEQDFKKLFQELAPNETHLVKLIQADLGDIGGPAPDHRNKANIAIKRVAIFLLVQGSAFHL